MILVTVRYRGKNTFVKCNSVSQMTKNTVSCYWYEGDGKVEHYTGHIIYVTSA